MVHEHKNVNNAPLAKVRFTSVNIMRLWTKYLIVIPQTAPFRVKCPASGASATKGCSSGVIIEYVLDIEIQFTS